MKESKPTKGIAILGSTGSIGTQALDVIRQNPDHFTVAVLTANTNSDLLIEQALEFNPNTVVIADEGQYKKVQDALWEKEIKVFAGSDSLKEVVSMAEVDTVLTALVGFSGLEPTIAAINAEKSLALANKETLVVAGEVITNLAQQKGVNIYPVDSEHSAIFQCIIGEFHNKIEKIYLTASGGPFRGKKYDELKGVTVKEALNHPNWSMGAKITIDSATMMNKGLEVIEAKWLFNLRKEQIDVVVHPESIIHSIAQFEDGSMKAQMGLPDMKLPIQFALTYPNRLPANFERFNFMDYPALHFEQPDRKTFRNLELAFQTLDQKGNAACALNAANEITVEAFLKEKINFLEIAEINEKVLSEYDFISKPVLNDLLETDNQARELAQKHIGN